MPHSVTRNVPSTPETPPAGVLGSLLGPAAPASILTLPALTEPAGLGGPVAIGAPAAAAQASADHAYLSQIDGPDALLGAAHAEAGAALARLHASTPHLPEQVRATLAVGLPSVMDLARRHAEVLADTDMDLAHRVLQVGALMPDLMDRMDRMDSGPQARSARLASAVSPVLCHGDASPRNVLVEVSTGQVWLTGFEHAVLAPAAVDLGAYLADARQDAVAPFLDGYTWAGGHLPSSWNLGAAVARARMGRLLDPCDSGEPTWRDQVRAGLNDLEEGTWRL